MKYIFTLVSCIIAVNCVAQHHPYYSHHPSDKKYDFTKVDPSTVDKDELKKKLEEAKIRSGYDSLAALTQYVYTTDENEFATIALGYQHAFASFTNLKRELAPMGLGKINENMSNFLVSLDLYKNRFMMSYIFTPGFRNLTSNENYELRTKRRAVEAGIGYDLIGNKHIDSLSADFDRLSGLLP